MISLKVRSKASKAYLSIIGASSQTIKLVTYKSKANSDPRDIGQVESSCKLKGILNLECAVRPPGKSRDAIPEDVTARAISNFCK